MDTNHEWTRIDTNAEEMCPRITPPSRDPAFASRYSGVSGYGAQAKFECLTMEQWRTGQ